MTTRRKGRKKSPVTPVKTVVLPVKKDESDVPTVDNVNIKQEEDELVSPSPPKKAKTSSKKVKISKNAKKAKKAKTVKKEKEEEVEVEIIPSQDFTMLVNLVESTTGQSTNNMYKSALNHLDYFLINSKFKSQTHDEIEKIDINSDFIGTLAAYFGEHARLKCDPSKELLSFNSAYNYLSSIKNYYCKKYKDEQPPSILLKENFGPFLRSIYKAKLTWARNNNEVRNRFIIC